MKRLAIILVLLAFACAHLSAADLNIDGKWMATEITSIESAPNDQIRKITGKVSLQCRPGFLVIDIGDGTMQTTLSLPEQPPKVRNMTYTVQKRSAEAVSLSVVDPNGKGGPKQTEIAKDGSGLVITGDGAVVKVIPYDAGAVAAELKRYADAEKAPDPLKDQPLANHINGADWTPVQARRSSFQSDKKGEYIRVESP